VIIGGLTGHGNPLNHTHYWWVEDLVKESLEIGRKVFIKNNLGQGYIDSCEQKFGVSMRQLLWPVYGDKK
jgi:hypothetical protein